MSFTDEQKQSLQAFYQSCRHLLGSGISTSHFVQRSFEEMLAGVRLHDSWRPTHISHTAAVAASEGRREDIQRAHGILPGRLDRQTRTSTLLTGPELPFDEWWEFFCAHDSTVLVTRKEHSEQVPLSSMIALPDFSLGMFASYGFKVKMRQTVEVQWLRNQLLVSEAKQVG